MAELKKPTETVSPIDAVSGAPAGASTGRGDSGARPGKPGSGSLRRIPWSGPPPHGAPGEEADRPVRKGARPLVLTVVALAALVVVAGVTGSVVWAITSSHSASPNAAPAAATGRPSLVGVPLGTGGLTAISPQPGAASTGPGATPSPSAALTQPPSASAATTATASATAGIGAQALPAGTATSAAPSPTKAAASTTSAATVSVVTYRALPGTWPQCAAENANCSFSGTKAVAFGANGRFNYAVGTGTIACDVGTLGDPIYFTVKSCYAQAVAPTSGVWSSCAAENGTCAFSGIMTVAFGANGNYRYATLGGGTACSVSVFGDPAYYTVKSCYLMGPPPSFTTWKTCAVEDQTCSFSGTHEVAFGSSGRYFYGTFTGSAPCDSAVFGDPIIGVQKTCFVQ